MVSYNPNDDRLPAFISSSSKINRGYWRIALPCLVRNFSFWPSWCRVTCVTACHSPFFIWNKTIGRLLYYNAPDIFVQNLITVWLLCANKIVHLWKKIEVDTSRRVDQAKRKKKVCTWVKLNSDSNTSTDESCEHYLPWNLLQTLKILYISYEKMPCN